MAVLLVDILDKTAVYHLGGPAEWADEFELLLLFLYVVAITFYVVGNFDFPNCKSKYTFYDLSTAVTDALEELADFGNVRGWLSRRCSGVTNVDVGCKYLVERVDFLDNKVYTPVIVAEDVTLVGVNFLLIKSIKVLLEQLYVERPVNDTTLRSIYYGHKNRIYAYAAQGSTAVASAAENLETVSLLSLVFNYDSCSEFSFEIRNRRKLHELLMTDLWYFAVSSVGGDMEMHLSKLKLHFLIRASYDHAVSVGGILISCRHVLRDFDRKLMSVVDLCFEHHPNNVENRLRMYAELFSKELLFSLTTIVSDYLQRKTSDAYSAHDIYNIVVYVTVVAVYYFGLIHIICL